MLTKDGEGNITTYKYNVRNLPYQRIDDGGEGVASKTESYTYYANNLLRRQNRSQWNSHIIHMMCSEGFKRKSPVVCKQVIPMIITQPADY